MTAPYGRMMIKDGGYSFRFTNIYFDQLTAGGPIVRCEQVMHATERQLAAWMGVGLVAGVKKTIERLLDSVDGCMRSMEASLNASMTR